jgi:hypothetical protein
VIEDGFGRRGYREIRATAGDRNVASVRALARLGFTASADGSYVLRREDDAG